MGWGLLLHPLTSLPPPPPPLPPPLLLPPPSIHPSSGMEREEEREEERGGFRSDRGERVSERQQGRDIKNMLKGHYCLSVKAFFLDSLVEYADTPHKQRHGAAEILKSITQTTRQDIQTSQREAESKREALA